MSKQSQTPTTCYKQLYQLGSDRTDLNETRIVTSNLKKRLYLIKVICPMYIIFVKNGHNILEKQL